MLVFLYLLFKVDKTERLVAYVLGWSSTKIGPSVSSLVEVDGRADPDDPGKTLDTSILFSANQDINTRRKYFEYFVGSLKYVACFGRFLNCLCFVANSLKNGFAKQAMADTTRTTTPHTFPHRCSG